MNSHEGCQDTRSKAYSSFFARCIIVERALSFCIKSGTCINQHEDWPGTWPAMPVLSYATGVSLSWLVQMMLIRITELSGGNSVIFQKSTENE